MANINISPKLIQALEVLRGASIDENLVQSINEGKVDLLIGRIVLQNTVQDSSKDNAILSQVTIRTNTGEDFTFSNNEYFKVSDKALSLGNADFINRPKVTFISNLEDFSGRFQDAARYGQKIACLYERTASHKFILVGIASDSSNNENLARNVANYDDCWPCLD